MQGPRQSPTAAAGPDPVATTLAAVRKQPPSVTDSHASVPPQASLTGRNLALAERALTDVEPHFRPWGLVARIGGGAAVIGVTTWVAVEGLPEWEERLFSALNGGPGSLEVVLWLPMQLGSLFGPFVVGGATWRWWRRWRPSVGSVVAGVLA